jgi:hypothetical protein
MHWPTGAAAPSPAAKLEINRCSTKCDCSATHVFPAQQRAALCAGDVTDNMHACGHQPLLSWSRHNINDLSEQPCRPILAVKLLRFRSTRNSQTGSSSGSSSSGSSGSSSSRQCQLRATRHKSKVRLAEWTRFCSEPLSHKRVYAAGGFLADHLPGHYCLMQPVRCRAEHSCGDSEVSFCLTFSVIRQQNATLAT